MNVSFLGFGDEGGLLKFLWVSFMVVGDERGFLSFIFFLGFSGFWRFRGFSGFFFFFSSLIWNLRSGRWS